MNIVVLAGGLSDERDVSLNSSCLICNALRKKGHHAIMLDVYLGLTDVPSPIENIFDINCQEEVEIIKIPSTAPDLEKIKAKRTGDTKGYFGPHVIEICQAADIVYMGLHGGNGENGELQAALKTLGIPYTGCDSLGSALAMDKGLTKKIFSTSGIPTPDGVVLQKADKDKTLKELGLTLPVVVKPCSGGSSIGVSIPQTEEEYKKAVLEAFEYENELILETYIKGREFAVSYLCGRALPPIEIIPKTGFYDYENKYQSGRTIEICPAELTEEQTAKMCALTEKAFHALKLNVYARADFIMTEDGSMYCLEFNNLPGMTPISLLPQEAAAVGIDYETLCETVVQKSLEKYQ